MKKILNLIVLLGFLGCFSVFSQSPVKVWTGTHNSTVTSVDVLPDGRVLSASYDGNVKLWDTNGVGSVIYTSPFVNGRYLPINSIATDGFIAVVGLDGGLVQKINSSNFNIGVDVLGVAAKNGHTAAVGRNDRVYYGGSIVAYSSPGSWNYAICFTDSNELVWGSTDGYVRTSWGYYFQDTDWILGVDVYQNRIVSVGASPYVRINGQVIFVLSELGASSVNINRLNNKILVAGYEPRIYVLTSQGNFLDGIVDKSFTESALVRSVKWVNNNQFVYGTADGRVVLANNDYSSSNTSTNTPIIPKKKGRK